MLSDNVTLQIDGVLYLRILDPFKVAISNNVLSYSSDNCVINAFVCALVTSHCFQASYGVEDPEYAVTQLAQTTMRSELGKLTLDKVFRVTNLCWISHFSAFLSF